MNGADFFRARDLGRDERIAQLPEVVLQRGQVVYFFHAKALSTWRLHKPTSGEQWPKTVDLIGRASAGQTQRRLAISLHS
jgi:hypothetical protein